MDRERKMSRAVEVCPRDVIIAERRRRIYDEKVARNLF